MNQDSPEPDDPGPLDLPGEEETPRVPIYPHKHKRPHRGGKKLLIALIVVAVLIIGGRAAWWFVKKPSHKSPSTTASASASSSGPSVPTDAPASTTTKNYTNDILGFTLSYPTTWTLTTTNDNGVRITSPQFTYQTTDHQSINGYFRFYVRQQARAVDSKYIGRAVAVQPSQTLNYSHPTGDQRKSTLITNFGLDTPDNFAFVMVAGNFQLNKGDTLGPNYGTEQGTFIIAGGFSSQDLTDDLATHEVPLNWYSHTHAYQQALDIIKSLQLQ